MCGIEYAENALILADLPKDPDLDYGVFEGAGSSSGEMLFAYETDGASIALIRDNMDGTGVLAERIGTTAVPTGDVFYSGDYVGLVTDADNGNVIYIINADADFEVEFGDGNVFAEITNRTVLGPTGDAALGVTADPVFMVGSVTNQGVFSGTTTGGDISALSTTDAQAGTFDGLAAGSNGDELVGGLSITHSRPSTDYLEEGAFYAENDTVM